MNLEEQFKIGESILSELFKLNSKELKSKIKDLLIEFGIILSNDDLLINGSVSKLIENDYPSKITICFYDKIIINNWGIIFQKETGGSKELIRFNKHFKL
jgi:lipopolysaccharide biosynthesis glycosyltransferase